MGAASTTPRAQASNWALPSSCNLKSTGFGTWGCNVGANGRKTEGFSSAAIRAMQEYHWPGNIRELRNCIERAVVLSSSSTIDVPDLALSTLASPGDTGKIESSATNFTPETLATVEKRHILATLECTGGNKTKAAKLLGIERSTLDRKFARWGKTD